MRTNHATDRPRRRRARAERGSATLEIVVLAPVLLLFVVLVIFAGRWALAQQAVQAAASEAARAASIARSPGEANTSAAGAASASLTNQAVRCGTQSVAVDTAAFGLPEGTPGTVAATVTCVVDMSDLGMPGVPGSRTLTSTMTSPLDTYRNRQG
ncbi:TadE/TadG family type IV pilus assembly protein [uncultured Serinicoccus sp.]|uniref:TadE/TadG family type IV pilus assembly protein n=1 Tax=uncultured Serinicoccus sp. TaxID=735514 RepID=UPI002605776E|nr:TadE/TadG family type IV pilus assembly protein [uncultured Serinicoccus sp.]